MHRLTNIIIGIAVALISISLWAYINKPADSPAWPKRVMGFSFSPYHVDQDPREQMYPSVEQIEADMKLLAGKTVAIRSYSVEGTMAEIPRLARKHNLNVCLGAYLDYRHEKNAVEFATFLELAKKNPNVVRAIVGNEILTLDLKLDKDIKSSKQALIKYLDQARKELNIPVSTAESAKIWHDHPDLVKHVDFIAVQILPYWEGREVNEAVNFAFDTVKGLKEKYPNKPVIISEIGWPSRGRTRHEAIASVSNQAKFLRNFLSRAPSEGHVYYIMEAFDQPWKTNIEGAVGAYWGVYNVDREPKFEFTQPISLMPNWKVLAGISIVLAIITFALLLIDSKHMHRYGRSFLAIISYFAATIIVLIVYEYSSLYLTVSTIIIGVLLIAGMIGIIAVLLAEAHEWAEAIWYKHRRRELNLFQPSDAPCMKVSVHVPCYNEPPEMVRQTLEALAKLEYPDFEVIVVDNNTKDENVWQPLREICQQLGPKFRFYHVEPLAGFKAGALNYALDRTAKDAEVVAVIDSDYIVEPNWLRDLVPYFSNEKIAIVQAPQDYRDEKENAFKSMCYSEYMGFFFIGMVTRNERNAIIQHGTMTLIKKHVLQHVGGWAEWCITEDAELGLRIFEEGYEAIYTPKSYGKGLMPDTFNDYQKQRYRWAYGAVNILKHHFKSLFGRNGSQLSYGQRYHFIAGWLPWIADGVNLFFSIAAVLWSAGMILFPKMVDPPLVIFAVLPLTLFCFKIAKIIYLYKTTVNVSMKRTISAAVAGLALSHSIATAILHGLITRNTPFFRTPKLKTPNRLHRAMSEARWEVFFVMALWGSAIGVSIAQPDGGLDLQLWMALLVIQSLPYCAAIYMAFVSGLSSLPARNEVENDKLVTPP
jgi:exo-beta-1,3-glucanase (GH17 family)/cellulose synthase/poly-beta-1,6-N-acetylglucosamine synthase-like glycosyltransferase